MDAIVRQNVDIKNQIMKLILEEGNIEMVLTARRASRVNLTGRIKCGTESNGGFKNITIFNCVFDGYRGFALESVDGALLEDITFTGATMRDCTNTPIFLRLGSRMRGPAGVPVGTLKRIIISDVATYNSSSRFG